MNKPIKLSTTYSLWLDAKTVDLLTLPILNNDRGYSLRMAGYKQISLVYTLPQESDNEYSHKAVQKWIREQIKLAKARK